MVIPSQFQHIGTHSSLRGKRQKLRERFFDRGTVLVRRKNPPARIISTMPTYPGSNLSLGYNFYKLVWFTRANKGDHFAIDFGKPVRLAGILMVSGVHPAPFDVFSSDTQLFARERHGNEVLLANFTTYGDLMVRLKGFEANALVVRVNSNHSKWVLLAHIEVDAE